jgi:hypothetical protein
LDVYFHTSAVSNNPKSSNELSCFSSFAACPPLTFPVPQSPNPPNDVAPEDPANESNPPPKPEVPPNAAELEAPVVVVNPPVGFPNAAEELPVEELTPVEVLNPGNPVVVVVEVEVGGGGVAVLAQGFEYPPFPPVVPPVTVAVALIEAHGSENDVVAGGGGVALLVGIRLLNNWIGFALVVGGATGALEEGVEEERLKFEAYVDAVNVVGGAGDGANAGVKLGVDVAGVTAGLGVDFVVLDFGTGSANVLGMIGFVGCGAIVLVCPKDNLGDVRPANEDCGGLVALTLVCGAISNPPNADDKSPKALKLDCTGGDVVVTGGATDAGAG